MGVVVRQGQMGIRDRLGTPGLGLAGPAGKPKQDHPLFAFLERGVKAIRGEGVDRATGAQQAGTRGAQPTKKRAATDIVLV